jgi:hypothetical protein
VAKEGLGLAVPQTVRGATLGKRDLRLVRKDFVFHGLVDGKPCVEGGDAEEVWARLQHEAGKADPISLLRLCRGQKPFGKTNPE